MKNDLVASAVKVAPAMGDNVWLWLKSHDINWWVSVATIAYIELRAYYLIKSEGEEGISRWLTYRRRHSRVLLGLLQQPFFSMVPKFEGVKLIGYRDPVSIPTKCMGFTTSVVVGHRYSRAECRESLEQ